MDLLSPWFLAGGLAVGLPLWLHLMRRANPERLPFSSLMFFQKRTETSVRERRLRYKMLLALRLALLLLLALAFAKPVWLRPPVAFATDLPRLHVIAVDTSLSMGYADRWSRAAGVAEQLVDALGEADRALVLANGPSVRVLTAATQDRRELRSALAGLEPTDARNNYGDAIEAVRNLVADEDSPVTVHLISDLQQSAMPERFQDLVLPDGAELEVHDIAGEERENWAIESVSGAKRIYGRDPARIEVTVASFAEREAEKTVTLRIDGRPAGSERVTVPAGSRATFSFEIGEAPRGFSRAEFELTPADGLPRDDLRRAALDNSDPEPVLFVSGDARQRDLLYFRTALDASESARFALEIGEAPRGFSRAEFELTPADGLPRDDLRRAALDNSDPEPVLFVSGDARQRDLLYFRTALDASESARFALESATPAEAARLNPGGYALVVLSDVPDIPAAFASRLQTWIRNGGAAFVALGPNSALAGRVSLTRHAVDQPLASESGGVPFQVAGEADIAHPVVSAAEGMRPVKFYLHARIRTAPGDHVALRLGNGDPLLVDHQIGKGRALLFASPLDNVWNDLPLTAVFVPFVAEAARYLGGVDSGRGEALLGDVLELGRWRGDRGSLQVASPSGEQVLSLAEAVNRDVLALDSLGFYEILGGRQTELVAVNPDPRESDLRQVDPDRVDLWKATGGEASAVTQGDSDPEDAPPWRIWKLALALLLGTVLLESLVGNRHLDAVRGD